jgi:hypothetical protein
MNLFYKIWMDSVNNENSYARVDVHWSDVPGRDEAWKVETIRNTSIDQFRQEFECLDGDTEINILIDGISKKVAIKEFHKEYNVTESQLYNIITGKRNVL